MPHGHRNREHKGYSWHRGMCSQFYKFICQVLLLVYIAAIFCLLWCLLKMCVHHFLKVSYNPSMPTTAHCFVNHYTTFKPCHQQTNTFQRSSNLVCNKIILQAYIFLERRLFSHIFGVIILLKTILHLNGLG